MNPTSGRRFCSSCRTGALAATLFLTGCGVFDSGVIWTGGPYTLRWIDQPDNVTLSCDLGAGRSMGLIERCVFAVGWDGRYLVAKQHPACDRRITQFYVVDRSGGSCDPRESVIGPLSAAEFEKRAAALRLPAFSTRLEALK